MGLSKFSPPFPLTKLFIQLYPVMHCTLEEMSLSNWTFLFLNAIKKSTSSPALVMKSMPKQLHRNMSSQYFTLLIPIPPRPSLCRPVNNWCSIPCLDCHAHICNAVEYIICLRITWSLQQQGTDDDVVITGIGGVVTSPTSQCYG